VVGLEGRHLSWQRGVVGSYITSGGLQPIPEFLIVLAEDVAGVETSDAELGGEFASQNILLASQD